MSSGPSHSRITVVLMELGFLAGAACGAFAFIPLPSMTQRGPGHFAFSSVMPLLVGFALVGAVFGTLLGPVLGWVNVRRFPIRTIVLQTSIGTVLGEVLLGAPLHQFGSLPVDSLIFGGILGATLATARLRFFSSRFPFVNSKSASRG